MWLICCVPVVKYYTPQVKCMEVMWGYIETFEALALFLCGIIFKDGNTQNVPYLTLIRLIGPEHGSPRFTVIGICQDVIHMHQNGRKSLSHWSSSPPLIGQRSGLGGSWVTGSVSFYEYCLHWSPPRACSSIGWHGFLNPSKNTN